MKKMSQLRSILLFLFILSTGLSIFDHSANAQYATRSSSRRSFSHGYEPRNSVEKSANPFNSQQYHDLSFQRVFPKSRLNVEVDSGASNLGRSRINEKYRNLELDRQLILKSRNQEKMRFLKVDNGRTQDQVSHTQTLEVRPINLPRHLDPLAQPVASESQKKAMSYSDGTIPYEYPRVMLDPEFFKRQVHFHINRAKQSILMVCGTSSPDPTKAMEFD